MTSPAIQLHLGFFSLWVHNFLNGPKGLKLGQIATGHHFEKQCFCRQKGHYFSAVPPDKRAPFSKMVPQGHCFSQTGALSTKGALFWCPQGTIFQQKKVGNGTLGAPRRHCFQPSFGKRCPFSWKGTILVPLWQCFRIENVWNNSAPLESGTKTVPQKVPFYGQSNGVIYFFECNCFFLFVLGGHARPIMLILVNRSV